MFIVPRPPNTWEYKAEFSAYYCAKMRCTNINDPRYKSYGGRGIKFLYLSFYDFMRDVGPRPEGLCKSGKVSAYSLDRINNDGNYEPGNCRWTTWAEQSQNRRVRTSSVGGEGVLMQVYLSKKEAEEVQRLASEASSSVSSTIRNLLLRTLVV